MKKGKKIWNRLLSLVLCLVMVTGVFAGMGMEAEAEAAETGKLTFVVRNTKGQDITADCSLKYSDPYSGEKEVSLKQNTKTVYKNKSQDYTITCDGYLSSQFWHTLSEDNGSKEVTLYRNSPVTVTVKDMSGSPIKGALVRVILSNNGGLAEGETDAEGKFTCSFSQEKTVMTILVRYEDKSSASYDYPSENIGFNGQNYTYSIWRKTPVDVQLMIGNQRIGGSINISNSVDDLDNEFLSDKSSNSINLISEDYEDANKYNFSSTHSAYCITNGSHTITDNTTSITLQAELNDLIIKDTDSDKIIGSTYEMTVGETVKFKVANSLAEASYTWQSSDAEKITVGNDGTITALKPIDNATVTVTCLIGGENISKTINLTVNPKNPETSVTVPDMTYGTVEGNVQLWSEIAGTFTIAGQEYKVKENESKLISATEVITDTPNATETATLTYSFKPDSDEYAEITEKLSEVFKVNRAPLADAKVVTKKKEFVYDGNPQKVNYEDLTVTLNGKELDGGVDYELREDSYSNIVNVNNEPDRTNVGQVFVQVFGIGNYCEQSKKVNINDMSNSFYIRPRKIKVAAKDVSITYGESLPNDVGSVSISGIEGNDRSGLVNNHIVKSVTLEASTKDVTNTGTVTPVSVKIIDNYANDVSNNYEMIPKGGSLKINPFPLTISLNGESIEKTYDGNNVATIPSEAWNFNAFTNDDVRIKANSSDYDSKDAGENKTVTATGIEILGIDATNYTIEDDLEVTTYNATISQRPIYVSGIIANDKPYDGNTTATWDAQNREIHNVIPGEEGAIDIQVKNAEFEDANVKGNEEDQIVDLTLEITSAAENISAANYTLNTTLQQQEMPSAQIFRSPVTVSRIEAADKTYDGTKDVTLDCSNAVISNLVGSETLNVIASGEFVKKDVVDNTNVNYNVKINSIGLSDAAGIANNYVVDLTNSQQTATAEITPKALIIDGIKAQDKTYDTNTSAILDYEKVEFGNIVPGESLNIQATGTFDTKDVGTGKKVTISDIKLSDKDGFLASNYSVGGASQTETTANIYQKDIDVIVEVNNKQFDGKTDATIKEAYLNGVYDVDKDTVELINGTPTFVDAGVADVEDSGTETAVTFTAFTISGNNAPNYNLTNPQPTGVKANIYNRYIAKQGVDYTVNSNDWLNSDFVVTASAGYQISETENGTWGNELTCSADETEGTLRFYVRRDSDGAISKVVTEIYNIDKVEPTGKITIATNSWKEFLNDISFGTFFNKTQKVTITPADDRSGIAKVEYYESVEALNEKQLMALPADAWTEGDSVNVTLEDAKKFVYYARITDKAGNQICISSDGSVYDITYPAITGITNGETYYTTQVAEISDTNLDEVTFNGESLTITEGKIEPITLEGNKDTTYAIVATDKAGNVTTVTVTMKTMASLSDQLADVTVENVTSEDAELIDEIQKIIADENQSNATEDEKELLKELSEKCDDLEESLEETKEAVGNATEAVDKVTEGSVTLNEESELEEAKENLEKTLANSKNNLTEEEKKAIQKTIDDLDAMIDVIEKVKDAIKAVEAAKSADGEYGVPDNEAAVSAYERAKSAYNRLTEEQKAMLGSDVKKALEDAKTAIINYKIIEGDGKIWVYDTNGTLTFVGNGLVRKLKNVIVDGEVFPMENCHISKGSTVVEVEASALYWLGLGSHTFQLEYTDGKSDVVEFSIVTMEEWNAMMNQTSTNQTGTGAATGDSANILLWGAALAVGAAGMVVAKKRRKDEEA